MSRFPSEAHFASFLGLCPDNQITGGKVRRRGTRHVKTVPPPPYAWLLPVYGAVKPTWAPSSAAARTPGCAQSDHRHGPYASPARLPHAQYGEQYVDKGMNYYEEKYRDQEIRTIQKKAKQLGLEVTLTPVAA